jgi:hypothetical protein
MISANRRQSQQKLLAIALSLLAIIVFAFHIVRQIEKNPLRMDEVDIYNSIVNWVTLGTPILYLGQPMPPSEWLLPLGERTLGDGNLYHFYRIKPELGIKKEFFIATRDGIVGRYTYSPHPQLYLAINALIYRLIPLNPDASYLMRYFNLVWIVGLIIGMALLSRKLYREHFPLIFSISLLILSINNFAVRASLLIDYQAPTACLSTWYACAFVSRKRHERLSFLLVMIILLFWFNNFGATISILLGTIIYVLFLGWRVRLWVRLLSVFIGSLIFVPVYWLFCRVFELPFSQPFIYATSRVGDAKVGLAGVAANIWTYGHWYSLEIGPWLVVTVLVLLGVSLLNRRIISRPDLALPPTLALTGILSQAALRADAFHFPKYVYFTVPLLCIFTAGELLTLATGTTSWRRFVRWAVVAVYVSLLGLSAAQAWRSIQAPGGTLYDPGEVGLVEAAQVARAEVPLNGIILARKDAGFLAQRQFIEWEGALLTNPVLLEKTIEHYNINYAIAGPLLLGPEAQVTWPYLSSAFEIVIDAGDYVLLRKR